MFSGIYDHTQRNYNRAQLSQFPQVDFAQWEWEIVNLCNLYKRLKPAHVIELGTWQGGTLYGWLTLAEPGTHVLTVDDCQPLELWQTWKPENVKLTNLVGDTHDGRTLHTVQLLMPSVDFLFIDADHTYAGVRQDFLDYGPLVIPGGIIAFHDILAPAPARNQDHIRVCELWREIQQAGYVTQELIAHPDQEWGGIGVVYL